VAKRNRESVVAVPVDSRDLPEGASIRRLWKGEVHEVFVRHAFAPPPVNRPAKEYRRQKAADRGWWRYEYKGKRYKTLSAVARRITGNPTVSGNWFFGLRRRRKCTASLLLK